jgi:hypothetical protein
LAEREERGCQLHANGKINHSPAPAHNNNKNPQSAGKPFAVPMRRKQPALQFGHSAYRARHWGNSRCGPYLRDIGEFMAQK